MVPHLLTDAGEAILIANASTLQRLERDFPEDFSQVWLNLDMPSFFPGVDPALHVGVLYFCSRPLERLQRFHESFSGIVTPAELATILDKARHRHFTSECIEQPWEAATSTGKLFRACCDEMQRRRDQEPRQQV